jgi:integrase
MMRTDRAGRPIPDNAWRKGRPSPTKGKRYPPDPPSREQILRALGTLGESRQDLRLAALIVILWRGALTIGEVLRAMPDDLKLFEDNGWLRVRGPNARVATLDMIAMDWLASWLVERRELPTGPLLCILRGPTAGQSWSDTGARVDLARLGAQADVPQLTPRQLRHAWVHEQLKRGKPFREIGDELAMNRTSLYRLGMPRRRDGDETG